MITPEEYGYCSAEILQQASEEMKRNRNYQRILEKWTAASRRGQYVQQMQLHQQLRQMEADVIDRIVKAEDERRKSVKAVSDMLSKINHDDFLRYQDLMSCLCFLLDMIDYTFADINDVLHRNKIGVQMENFPEIKKCKALAAELSAKEVNSMSDTQQQLWMEEADRLWEHLQQRAAVYRRKVDRKEAKCEGQQ